MSNSIILNHEQISKKIKRIAYQILEVNSQESEIVLAGIAANGYLFAELLKIELVSISKIQITLCKVIINKKSPLSPVKTSISSDEYTNKSLVLVDDVLDSGTTLMYGIKHFLEVPLKQFKTAVLVNRNHKKYPVKADFKGVSLATTLQDTITVEFKEENNLAYLA
ncbi:phosphoribosyltransferase domain-containing protein [Urechidicola sp. KH5]